jgi:hypothetical protein
LRWIVVVLFLVLILLIGGALGTVSGVLPVAVLFPGITSATVTITPDSQMVQQSYQIAAATPGAGPFSFRDDFPSDKNRHGDWKRQLSCSSCYG